MADLDERIRYARQAVGVIPNTHPDWLAWLDILGVQLHERYSQEGAMADLEEAIQVGRQASNATPKTHPNRAKILTNFRMQLDDRYSSSGEVTDLEEAICIGREAVHATPENHPDRAALLNDLGVGLADRYLRLGAIADLEEAIQVGREAVSKTPEEHPDRVARLNNLGCHLGDRYLRTGAMIDLEESIQAAREAVNATTEDDPERAGHLSNLGAGLRDRYLRTGTLTDLEEAIQIGREALSAVPEGHPDRAAFLINLGTRLNSRYLRNGVTADLEEAIHVGREAVNASPQDHPDRAARLNNLGCHLGDRYLRTGAMIDLEEGIQFAREAVDATAEDHPERAAWLNNLGSRLSDRFFRTGAMINLEEAIQITREAINATLGDYLDRSMHLNNLGVRLSYRWLRTGVISDLEEAIQVGRESVVATPEDHPERAGRLSNLGAGLRDRYLRTGEMADLEEAIQVGQKALSAVPEGHPDQAEFLNNLGISLNDRYLRTGAITDLEEATHVARETVDATPEDHPDRAMWLNNLGGRLHDKYLRTRALADIQESVSCHRSALRQSNSATITRIVAGQHILKCCKTTLEWHQAYEDLVLAVSLVPKLTSRSFSLENSDKQHVLSQVVGLACNATAAALQLGKAPFVALNLLEQGRGVLAASLEEMRTDLVDLRATHPELADRFIHLRNKLEQPISRTIASRDINRKSYFKAGTDCNSVVDEELNKLIVEIHSKAGFENFLLPPTQEEMKAAAQFGPIAVINVSEYRCDALLVEQHQIRSLALPHLKMNEIEERAKRGGLGSSKVLSWLWDAITSPILTTLGFTQLASSEHWPHIWWVPTGALTKFPLHAAGHHFEGSTETVLDRVMSSYSSSIKAIVHGRQRRLRLGSTPMTPGQALLVAMQDTPQHTRLPFAADEVNMLHSLCKSMALDPIQPVRHKKGIMSHLLNCSIFHFAGHGYTDDTDPSQSSLLLEDWTGDRLTVATLLELNLHERPPFLAYLSACGTGEIKDERFFDESIHLISACQLAGFRHVIGTLWEVNDESCVDMAKITYKAISEGTMTDESVCMGLHEATRKLRQRWLDNNRHRSRSTVRLDTPAAESVVGPITTRDSNQWDSRLPRKIVLDESDEDDTMLHWVPYVHFGV